MHSEDIPALTWTRLAQKLLRNTVLIVLIGVIGAGAAYAWAATRPLTYSATASLVAANLQRVPTYVRLASSDEVLDGAVSGLSVADARAQLTVTTPSKTNFVMVKATGRDPQQVADLANAVADGLQREARQIEEALGNSASDDALRVVTAAHAPQNPTRDDRLVYTLAGFVIGVLIGVVVVLAREWWGRPIKGMRDVRAQAPGIPIVDMGAAQPGSSPASPSRSGRGTLHRQVAFLQLAHPRVLVCLVPGTSDRRAVGAADVARALTAEGRTVMLVDADFVESSASRSCGVDASRGLTDVLLGAAAHADVAVLQGDLTVVPPGDAPPNPDEVLASEEMREFLASAEASHESVVVQLGAGAERHFPWVGVRAAVIVTRGRTTTRQLRITLRNLAEQNIAPAVLLASAGKETPDAEAPAPGG
ncbi:hypothetical protein [Microbacterium sp.]|uniref:hypothetical protein n=1 Tax=Microbacterium sp. TaxID=51671 RepID=UPI003A877B1E